MIREIEKRDENKTKFCLKGLIKKFLKSILLAMTRRERTYQRERDVDDYTYIK